MRDAQPGYLAWPGAPRRDRARLPGRPAPAGRPRALRARARAEARAGRSARSPRADVPEWVKHTVRVRHCRPRATSAIPWEGGQARVIGLIPDQIVTELARRGADRRGRATSSPTQPRPGQDRRDRAPPRHGPDRARASCAASACGAARSPRRSPTTRTTSSSSASSDDDMARAVARLAELGGGIVVVEDGGVRAELPLPDRRPPLRRAARRGRRAQPRLHRRGRAARLHARRRRSRRWRSSRCR